jgi:NAD(P)H-dependent FMN reductase
MPKLLIILASTRPGRVGEPVTDWFAAKATAHGGFEIDVADLAELALPLMDEPNHPRLGRYEFEHTKAWSARVAAADAVAFVMPEYNHSYVAPLKNAFDFLHNEWQYKPAGFVTYGGIAAGTRALQAFKPVVAAVKMVPAVEAVNIPFVRQFVNEDEVLEPNEVLDQAAETMLDELVKLNGALSPLRSGAAAAA